MKLSNFLAGVQILIKYFDEPDTYQIGADKDEIHICPTNKSVSDDDVMELRLLGWKQPEAPRGYDRTQIWVAKI